MRKKYEQMSLLDTYKSIEERLENNKPELFRLLDEHLDWEEIIPARFYSAFYRRLGRKRGYGLESFLRALFLQRIFHYVEDSQLLNTLRFSYEMRDYCGFEKVPDASKLTRFKQDFCEYIRDVFERLVDMTEPICAEMDKALADMLVYDTTGIESYVAENNPKFMNKMAAQSRSIAKLDPTFDPSGGAAALLPKAAKKPLSHSTPAEVCQPLMWTSMRTVLRFALPTANPSSLAAMQMGLTVLRVSNLSVPNQNW